MTLRERLCFSEAGCALRLHRVARRSCEALALILANGRGVSSTAKRPVSRAGWLYAAPRPSPDLSESVSAAAFDSGNFATVWQSGSSGLTGTQDSEIFLQR